MPRRNNRKPRPYVGTASIYDKGYKPECYGCAFVGAGFKCLAADGCLLSKPEKKEGGGHAQDTGGTNRTGTKH